jgi:glycosyltransferase involved in cell wall biosynthesis
MNIEWHHAVPLADYMDKLNDLRLDIMLIPREDNYFNRCKSNVKFLEASMCEVPVIAQGFPDGNSPYQGVDEKQLVICNTIDEWSVAVNALILDKSRRTEMGKSAKKYVLENYNINNNAELWRKEYVKLLV